MAKKSSGVNKSQAIRDYYAAHPQAKPMAVAAALKKKGVDVSPAFVSTIRSTSKKKSSKSRRSAATKSTRRGRSAGRSGALRDVSIESLVKLKSVVNELGGVDQTRRALDALEALLT